MTPILGALKRVDLRQAWPNEASSFTPWLASEAGLELLQETLAMDLQVEATEQFVGPFKADIVAKRTDTPEEHWVLIENQLERTDHRHLGQLLTYAAGLKAAAIVWVAQKFLEEHRAALDWLNEITPDSIGFYGLEVELWSIGTSAPAPKFNIVAQPNEWARGVKQAAEGTPTALREQQQRYWQALATVLKERKSALEPQKANPGPWATFSIGRSGVVLDATMNTKRKDISVQLRLTGPNAKPWFDLLAAEKGQIERQVEVALDWRRQEDTKRSLIVLVRPNTDATNEADWPVQHEWLAENLERMRRAFQERIRRLPDDLAGGDEVEPTENLGIEES